MVISRVVFFLMLLGVAHSETMLETFGSGGDQFQIEFVAVGNPGNSADDTGFGSVNYSYNIGKYEITREQVLKANSIGNLELNLFDMSSYGPNSIPDGNGPNKPAVGISWYEAARFVNLLNVLSSRPEAYKFTTQGFQLWAPSDSGYSSSNPYRNANARYFLPTIDEWYKAAYHDASSGGYFDFATGSDSRPSPVSGGTAAGSAVFGQAPNTAMADVNSAGGLSPHGTMAQHGNALEWVETARDGENNEASESRGIRSSYYLDGALSDAGNSGSYMSFDPSTDSMYVGFRVAMVPEPSSVILLFTGGLILAAWRRN